MWSISFIPIHSHTGSSLLETIKNLFEEIRLPIENCRGQSYDNAANISGKYNGLQAHIKEINKHAEYVPCAAHSLNLVGVEAVSVVPAVRNHFGIVQKLYVFFFCIDTPMELVETTCKFTVFPKKLKPNQMV